MPKASKFSNKGILPPSQIKHRDKATWVTAEEAAIIMTLLLQNAVGNSLESRFKLAIWPLVVNVVGEATSEGVRKSLMQCKTCYHKYVQNTLFIYMCLLIVSSLRLSTRLCGLCACFLGLAGMKESRW